MTLLLMGSLMVLPLLFFVLLRRHYSTKNLPPGPFSWPLLGTLLPNTGKQPFVQMSDLAKKYGPLMLVKFGMESTVWATTPTAAMEVLKTHDRVLSGRYVPHCSMIKGYIEYSMLWADCTDYWKMIRKLYRTELFSTKMLEAQSHVRERKVAELVHYLESKDGKAVQFADVMFGASLNILGALVFGKNYVYDYEEDESGSDNRLGMKASIRELIMLAADPTNPADLYPSIMGGTDIQGLRMAAARSVRRLNESWASIVEDRRADKTGSSQVDFLQVLIDAGFNDAQIDAMILEIFGAGSDSVAYTIEWAMAELLRHPGKLQKLRQELNEVVGAKSNNILKESHLPNLPYLHAVVKETLRLHPPLPFLLSHRAMETCKVMNYTIPKDSQVMVNAYAIGRNPSTWDDPLSFIPERFINSDVEYHGNHFHYIPFGAGRRICPAVSLASRVVRLILASLIHSFEWSLPNGMHHDQLDMKEGFGGTLLKELSLLVVPKKRA